MVCWRDSRVGQYSSTMKLKWLWIVLGSITGLVVLVAVVFSVTPWPSALIIRDMFQKNAKKMAGVMAPFAPTGVESVTGVQYAEHPTQPHVQPNGFTVLDVYYPSGTTDQLGTIVWTHGGAWISGNATNDQTYFEILASHGYTVVGVNYTYGPEAQYPTAVFELNQAHQYLLDHAEELHIDPSRLVLAGDSAGAQLTSQLATLITNPDYSAQMQLTPVLSPEQVQGLVLNCGVYDLSTLLGGGGLLGWGDDMSLWAYTGDRNLEDSAVLKQMSTIDHVTANFPVTYISGGNADPLTAGNSKPFAAKLQSLGVSVTELFWPSDYTPKLPHEYQFRLDLEAGQDALQATLDFLGARLG